MMFASTMNLEGENFIVFPACRAGTREIRNGRLDFPVFF
jgi:hypothetical protein